MPLLHPSHYAVAGQLCNPIWKHSQWQGRLREPGAPVTSLAPRLHGVARTSVSLRHPRSQRLYRLPSISTCPGRGDDDLDGVVTSISAVPSDSRLNPR